MLDAHVLLLHEQGDLPGDLVDKLPQVVLFPVVPALQRCLSINAYDSVSPIACSPEPELKARSEEHTSELQSPGESRMPSSA